MKTKPVIGISAPVAITAAEDAKGPAKFTSTFYTGGALEIAGYDLPVIVDLAGLSEGKVLVANQYHDSKRPVGNFAVANDGKTLVANGTATAATEARDEVVNSALAGYQWQSSLEVNPKQIETVKGHKPFTVNGQEFTGPHHIARKGVLKGFGFVTHGADDNTTATIAATAAQLKGTAMKPEIKAWAESMGIDVDSATPEAIATIEANYEGKAGKKPAAATPASPFEAHRLEAMRQSEINALADKRMEDIKASLGGKSPAVATVEAIEQMTAHAIEAKMAVQDFRFQLWEATNIPAGHTVRGSDKHRQLSGEVVEAAVCASLRLPGYEKLYNDQTLQAAHDRFKDGIGLKQLINIAAKQNGHETDTASEFSRSVLKAAFMETPRRPIHAQGWSYVEISSILSNVAGKFLREGFMAVEDTWSRISTIRNVRDFKSITTVSLVGDLQFEKLGAAGEIKHGTLGEVTYSNKADTYAKMLAITRQDIINDDLGALAAAPRRLGRGAATKLNDIFWTEWLGGEAAGFWSATHTDTGNTGNSNLNSGAADVTIAGLTATELLFLNQVDPQGLPLGIMPKIVLVPNALKAAMAALLHPQSQLITGSDTTKSNVNVFAGRFQLESSSYLGNSAYTGYSPQEWYMMADPNELSTIEIAALNGRVEPVVESADADFNTLGIQMRAYGDVGVNLQEFRASVLADGNGS
jgi:hypothetical protein